MASPSRLIGHDLRPVVKRLHLPARLRVEAASARKRETAFSLRGQWRTSAK